jgi:hypothetical protein
MVRTAGAARAHEDDGPSAVVECAGSPRDRGRAHGEQLRERIAFGLDRLRAEIVDDRATGEDPDTFLRDWLAGTTHLDAIELHTPALAEELRGIAEGANQPFEQILAFNLMDEMWAAIEDRERDPEAFERDHPLPGCSAVAVLDGDGGAPLLAQTMDLGPHSEGTQAVLRIREADGHEMLVVTRAGMIGLMGANAAGLGVCVNALTLLHHDRSGLPVAFVVRGMLGRRSLAEAKTFVQSVPHASGQAYHLASPDGLASYECSVAGAVAFAEGESGFAHTNHPLATDDVAPGVVEWPETARSGERLAFLRDHLQGIRTLDDCERLLEDRTAPICFVGEDPAGSVTIAAIALELTAPPAVRVALGPPTRAGFASVAFSSN